MRPSKPAETQTTPQSTQTATLAEIAREAGVSAPTVSKVLNGRADVAPATRTRVEDLLRAYGYRRRRAEATRSPLIDLVFHELESAWAMEVIRGVENAAREEGLSVVLSESAGRLTPGRTWADQVAARRPHGVVLVLSGLDESQRALLTSRSIPFVVMDPAGDPGDNVPSVGATNWQGGLAATRHLVELGHTRIASISGPSRMMCSRARVDGYRAALDTAGLSVDPALLKAGDFHHETGYRAGLELLRAPNRPTAVFAGNDLQALGLYEAARELGLRIPEDLSVVGFDDLPIARLVGPPLTTVRQPLMEMAETAAKLVLNLGREDGTSGATRVELATSLVVRNSTAPPPTP
ncbi:LacI family DNA-binding transcriptional regulator [Streptomyces turgidiscabies]|uniref:LacI family xylobiose transport system transcriptional regulator n=1 Tax=Streptomyces turgidiscabies TaxID=85558 RepID=A0ABU0RLK8_9ACTN|nr:LacI family DNA-binding transcriptional regulator [Streptomyces turgidiscabies]MDQ0932042.1 LacI family xylobiose transport system transcriptional regulator [Streptomyces turgidiscabies]